MYRDEIDELYFKVCELEALVDIFKVYCFSKSECGISQSDFGLHMDFFTASFYEKVNQLYSLLDDLIKNQRKVDNDEKP